MPPLYAEAMREHRATYGRTQHDYDLPAIAWRKILDSMIAQCYGPAGGKLKGQGRPSDSALLAIKRVAEAVKRIEGHPALRSASVEGYVADVIPAWAHQVTVGEPGKSGFMRVTALNNMTPYPAVEFVFVLLLPQHEHNLGMKVTRWRPIESVLKAGDAWSWTFSESSHLLFV